VLDLIFFFYYVNFLLKERLEMPETLIKPEDLKVGMRFRLTGEADDPAERNNKHIYEVFNINTACTQGAHLMVQDETGGEQEIMIPPWVKVLRIE
jgi:hypothetical protein